MITSNITSSTYTDGRRIEVVENTYSPSDDMMKLGQLQNMLGQMMARQEQILAQIETADAATRSGYDAEITRLDGEMATYTVLIQKQEEYVDGYGGL